MILRNDEMPEIGWDQQLRHGPASPAAPPPRHQVPAARPVTERMRFLDGSLIEITWINHGKWQGQMMRSARQEEDGVVGSSCVPTQLLSTPPAHPALPQMQGLSCWHPQTVSYSPATASQAPVRANRPAPAPTAPPHAMPAEEILSQHCHCPT